MDIVRVNTRKIDMTSSLTMKMVFMMLTHEHYGWKVLLIGPQSLWLEANNAYQAAK